MQVIDLEVRNGSGAERLTLAHAEQIWSASGGSGHRPL